MDYSKFHLTIINTINLKLLRNFYKDLCVLNGIKMGMLSFLKKKKLNVIMINIDAGGREDALKLVNFYQQELKNMSTCFSSVIAYAPYSIGSLNAILSGMYGNLNGVNGYYKPYHFDKKNVFTLAQYMQDAGYLTEMDWVLDEALASQGFDKVRIFGKDDSKEINLVDRHVELMLRAKSRQPFFLFLDYDKIALNLSRHVIKKYDDFSEEYFQKKDANFSRYRQWLEDSSNYLQRILEKIREFGLFEDTIVVIYCDHGSSVGDRIGEKVYGSYLYDYTIKCFAYFIGSGIPKNLEIKQVVRNIDIMPTILDILGIKEKSGYKPIQGKSLMPIINGKQDERIAYSETGGLGGPTPSPEVHNVQAVRTNEWKLIYNKTNKKREFYHLTEDKEEKNNLAGKGLGIEEQLWNEIRKLDEEHERINKRFGTAS